MLISRAFHDTVLMAYDKNEASITGVVEMPSHAGRTEIACIECRTIDQDGNVWIERFEQAAPHERATAFFMQYSTYDSYRLKLISRAPCARVDNDSAPQNLLAADIVLP